MLKSVEQLPKARRVDFSRILKRNRSLQFGIVVIISYAVISVLDLVYPQYIGVNNAFNLFSFANPTIAKIAYAAPTPPTLNGGIYYIFGTTAYKIPILPAILASIPADLVLALAIAGSSAIIGVVLGVSATYTSRKLEITIASFSNAFISFPLLISVIIFGLLLKFTLLALVVGIVAVLWAYYAQIARMLTLSVKGHQYIEAAKASGASGGRVMFSHIIPNILTPILVRLSTDMATVVVIFSAANFMFFHQFTPIATLPELGSLITGFPGFGYKYGFHPGGLPPVPFNPPTAETFILFGYWWTVLFPIIFLMLLVLGLMSFSDGLRKGLDPRTNF